MNFSEFIRQLGTDPASRDPEFLRARDASPEFAAAAVESDQFESRLRQALSINPPATLLPDLQSMAGHGATQRTPWRGYAVAASVLLAVAVAGITWRLSPETESLELYISHHYAHDGAELLQRGSGQVAGNVQQILATFGVALAPDTVRHIGFIKYCPTPQGRGAHLVMNTEDGPITVLFMPTTKVADGEMLEFDGMRAQLLVVTNGAAVVIGTTQQPVDAYQAVVRNSFLPLHAPA